MVCSTSFFAQSSPVDGWKKVNSFSLGDPKSKYSSKLTFWGKTVGGDNSYLYTTKGYYDDQNHTVYGNYYTHIYLIFDPKDVLTGMQFSISYFPGDSKSRLDYETIQQNLKKTLGSMATKLSNYENGYSHQGLTWTGSEVSLSFFTKDGGKNGSLSNELLISRKP